MASKGKELKTVITLAGNVDKSLGSAFSKLDKLLHSSKAKAAAVTAGIAAAGAIPVKVMAETAKATVKAAKVCVEAAQSYETAFSKTATLLEGDEKTIKGVSDAIIELSNKTGIAATELTDTVYNAISAGVNQADAVEFAGTAAKLAAAGFTDATTAVDVLTTAMNAYGDAAQDAETLSNYLVTTQNLGKTTVDELAASVGKVIPSAAASNMQMDQLSAAYADLTKNGIDTAEGGTYLKQMLTELGKEGSTVATALQTKTGKSFSQLMKDGKSLGDVIDLLSESVDGNVDKFKNMWSSTTASTAALALFNEGGQAFNETLEAMRDSAGTVDAAYAKVTDTLEHQLEVVKNLGQNFLISVGQEILPIVKDALEMATPKLQELVSKILPPLQNAIDKLAPAVGDVIDVAGDLIAEILPVVTDAVAELAPLVGDFIKSMLPPLIELIKQIITSVMPVVRSVMPTLINLFNRIAPVLGNMIARLLPSIVRLIEKLLPPITRIIEAVLPPVLDLLTSIEPLITQIVEQILPPVVELLANVIEAIMPFIETLLPPIIDLLNTIVPIITDAVNVLLPALEPLLDALVTPLTDSKDLLEPILDTITDLSPLISDAIKLLLPPLVQYITSVGKLLAPIVEAGLSILNVILEPLMPCIQTLINALMPIFEIKIQILTGYLPGMAWTIETLAGWLETAVNWFKKLIGVSDEYGNFTGRGGGANLSNIGGNGSGNFTGTNMTRAGKAFGGFTHGPTLAGEDPRFPTEAVISFNPTVRDKNIKYWLEAGTMLGLTDSASQADAAYKQTTYVSPLALRAMADVSSQKPIVDFSGVRYPGEGGATESIVVNFAPTVTVNGGGADKETVVRTVTQQLRELEPDVVDAIYEALERRQAVIY